MREQGATTSYEVGPELATSQQEGAAGEVPSRRRLTGLLPRRSSVPPGAVAALVLVALSVLVVGLNTQVNRQVSPYDEATHADYAYRVAHAELPAAGDRLEQEVLREWACRGGYETLRLPECGPGTFDPADFPAQGLQYNSGHPPLYYALTGVLARGVDAATGAGFLQSARWLGALWLSAGLLVLLAALRGLGVSWTAATAAGAVLALNPAVMHASSIVSNDAAAVLVGASVLAVTVGIVQGRCRWWWLGPVAAVAVATKIIFAAALVPAGVVLLARLVARRRRALGEEACRRVRFRSAAALLASGAVSAAVAGCWLVLQDARADPSWTNPVLGLNTQPADGFPVSVLVRNALAVWPPTARPFLENGLEEPGMVLWLAVSGLALAAAPLVGLAGHADALGRDLSAGAAVGLLCVPVLVEVYSYATSGHVFHELAPRYGLVLVPAVVLALAVGTRGRTGALALVAVGGVGLVALLGSLG